MRKGKIFQLASLFFISGLLIFTSCNDDDPQPVEVDAKVDVFVQKIMDGDVAKFAPSFFVVGNKELKTVTVTGPGDNGAIFTMVKDAVNSKVFSLLPESSEYVASMPAAGDYEFTVTSSQNEEEPIKVKDNLGTEELDAMVISATEFASAKLKTSWATLANAEGFVVRLFAANGDLLYNSPLVVKTDTEFSFGLTDLGWLDASKKAEDTKTYKVELAAIRYETGVTVDKEYNVQIVSMTSKDIVWGE